MTKARSCSDPENPLALTSPRLTHRLAVLLIVLTVGLALGGGPAGAQGTVTFVDWSWDSVQVHNRIAGFILEHGYGYTVDYLFADTLPGLLALQRGNVDIGMEIRPDNYLETWERAVSSGAVVELGLNFPDAAQGWYVPTYLIEGDPTRGIEPLAPDLKSVFDLPRYWQLFRDPEQPRKGRFYNAQNGWVAAAINEAKFKAYGLEDTMNLFDPGSDAALVSSMVAAYERGEPWVGYYWEPTWVMGKLNMTRLEEPPYDPECWEKNFGCAYPAARVYVAANARFLMANPELRPFLEAYSTTLEQNNEMLAHMQDAGGSAEEAARFFLTAYRDTWHRWVPADVAAKVDAALAAGR